MQFWLTTSDEPRLFYFNWSILAFCSPKFAEASPIINHLGGHAMGMPNFMGVLS
jgi:hypothetical protein